MNKFFALALLTLASVACSGIAMAQAATLAPDPKVIQVAAVNPETPVMTYEVALLMQSLQKAQAQYRRSGQPQDQARVEATRRELASRGFGRVTHSAPAIVAQSGSMQNTAGSNPVSLAD